MKKKNYRSRNYANKGKTNKKQNVNSNLKLYSNNLLDRILLVKGDLEELGKAINELGIFQTLSPDILKENVELVVKSIVKDFGKNGREQFYKKLFKDRVPIYNENVQIEEIIADSIQLIDVLSVAWNRERKEYIAKWLIYLQDNVQKIKIIVLALEQSINYLDQQLDFYFQIKSGINMVLSYIHEILHEYCNNNNLHLKSVS